MINRELLHYSNNDKNGMLFVIIEYCNIEYNIASSHGITIY